MPRGSGSDSSDGADPSAGLPQHPLVTRLKPDPAQPAQRVTELTGLPGDSDRQGYQRLYLTTKLDYYAEFRTEDLVHSEILAADRSPFRQLEATRVSIQREATINYTWARTPQPVDEFDLDIRLGGHTGRPPSRGQIRPADDTADTCETCDTDCGQNTCQQDCTAYTNCQQNTCDGTCAGDETCQTCNTNCNQNTCANTCQTCNTNCNQNTCANTCQTCNTNCNQNTCANTCQTCNTNCNQNTCVTCNTCHTDCNQHTCFGVHTCDTCNPRMFTCGPTFRTICC